MRIAVAQIVSTEDPAGNLDQVEEQTAKAAQDGAEIVVFPEATMCRFDGPPLAAIAEPLDGPWAAGVRAIAARHGVTVVAGMFTPGDDGRVRNTLLVAGAAEASYDKIHLFDAFGYRESASVEPGAAPAVFSLDGVGIGLATCYDVRFPGLFTALADAGAQVVLVCASWGSGPGKREQWELLTRARALDATVFVVASGQGDPRTIGRDDPVGSPTGVGASGVIAPDGVEIARLGAAPETRVIDLDVARVADVRERLPVLRNRRI